MQTALPGKSENKTTGSPKDPRKKHLCRRFKEGGGWGKKGEDTPSLSVVRSKKRGEGTWL